MKIQKLGLHDIVELNDLAEKVLTSFRLIGWHYDDEGNYLQSDSSNEQMNNLLKECYEILQYDWLDFKRNEILRSFSFNDCLYMDIEQIKTKYLANILKKARNIMRKDHTICGMIVSDEVDDEYLDNLLAIRWRENLKLRAFYNDDSSKRKEHL